MPTKIIRRVFWSDRLDQVKEFIKTHGRLPVKNSGDEFEDTLATWRQNYAAAFKAGKLKKLRAEALQKSGILYDPNEKEWNSRLERLIDFFQKYNRYPNQFALEKEEREIGRWRAGQIALIKLNNLSEERKEKFVNSGMSTSIYDHKWRSRLKEVVRFKKKHHRLPNVNGDTIEEINLGMWCKNVRTNIYKGSRTNARTRKTLLTAAGILDKPQVPIIWKANLDRLERFCQACGHLPASNGVGEEQLISAWYRNQLSRIRRNKLNEKQQELFFELKQKYKPKPLSRDVQWKERFHLVSLFIERNKRIPSLNKENPPEFKLAKWLYQQHVLIKEGLLDEKHAKAISRLHPALEDIKSVNPYKAAKWEKNYANVFNYVKKTGFLPAQHGVDTFDRNMNQWFMMQLNKAKSDSLDNDKKQRILSLSQMVSWRKRGRPRGPGKNHDNADKQQQYTEKKEQLLKLQTEYKTDAAIAKVLNISRQRVHQMRLTFNIPKLRKVRGGLLPQIQDQIVEELKRGLPMDREPRAVQADEFAIRRGASQGRT